LGSFWRVGGEGWIRKSFIHGSLRNRQMGSFGRRKDVAGCRDAGGRRYRMRKSRGPAPGGTNEAGALDLQE